MIYGRWFRHLSPSRRFHRCRHCSITLFPLSLSLSRAGVCIFYQSLVHWLWAVHKSPNWNASQSKLNGKVRRSFGSRSRVCACQWKLRDFRCGNFSCLFSLLSHTLDSIFPLSGTTFFCCEFHKFFICFLYSTFFSTPLFAWFDSIAMLNR